MRGNLKAYIVLAFICIVWGTTYLALRIAVQYYPPYLFAGVRQVVSGGLLLLWGVSMGKKCDLSWQNMLHQLIVGFLLLTVGNGCVTWGERTVPSGVAALICSAMPIFASLFNRLINKPAQTHWLGTVGMLVGCGGVAFIFRQDIASLGNPKYLWGILAILLATCSWALGSVINKKKGKAENPTFNAGLQLFFGGALMLLISPVADDYSHIDYFNTEGLLSLLYLIVFGSLLGYTAYMYVLRVLPVGVATIYAYINPLVAVLLGVAVMHETVNIYTLFAFVTIIAGVYMVNKGNNMPAKQSPETTEDKMVSTS